MAGLSATFRMMWMTSFDRRWPMIPWMLNMSFRALRSSRLRCISSLRSVARRMARSTTSLVERFRQVVDGAFLHGIYCRVDVVPKAVMISTVGACFNPLSFSRRSMPSIFPILRSESTTSGSYVLGQLQGFFAGGGRVGLISLIGKDGLEDVALEGFVVYDDRMTAMNCRLLKLPLSDPDPFQKGGG